MIDAALSSLFMSLYLSLFLSIYPSIGCSIFCIAEGFVFVISEFTPFHRTIAFPLNYKKIKEIFHACIAKVGVYIFGFIAFGLSENSISCFKGTGSRDKVRIN